MAQTQKGKKNLAIYLALLIGIFATVVSVAFYVGSNSGAKVTADVPRPTPAPNMCASNTSSGKLVLVSISRQHMWSCQGTAMVEQSAVTTGATVVPNNVNDATPLGTWHIYEKFRNLYLKGSDANGPWNDYVQYWMPFDVAVGFHDASWQTIPFGSSQYRTQGSHGCVQLPTSTAAWLYNWAPVGTTVTVTA
ncbi:MAG TPA: L,D-transpeptidase [Verrucomicrobiae bacterium]|nr:L,D-transpeptidase [Verrucomicrobiae bacterium]